MGCRVPVVIQLAPLGAVPTFHLGVVVTISMRPIDAEGKSSGSEARLKISGVVQ
jgi:hypothetical protein